jgi:nitrile hydratase accessory protein
MSAPALTAITSDDGPAALPRKNGELVFEAPWESRAFGVAIALHDAGAIDFEAFRARLIAERGRAGAEDDAGAYYECWLGALEQVVLEHGIVSAAELEECSASIAYDWAHDHDREHPHDPG